MPAITAQDYAASAAIEAAVIGLESILTSHVGGPAAFGDGIAIGLSFGLRLALDFPEEARAILGVADRAYGEGGLMPTSDDLKPDGFIDGYRVALGIAERTFAGVDGA